MEQQEVIRFFDRCAPFWDEDMVRNEAVISTILDNAGIRAGIDVLDVACGTGVLFPDYLKRGVASLTAIDISPEMQSLRGRNSRRSRCFAATRSRRNSGGALMS